MDVSIIKKRLEREQARQREAARKAQALGARLSTATRHNDTRRKILAGSWVLDKIEKSEDFRAMVLKELDRIWLSRDDDRALFELAPLSDEEKKRREIPGSKRNSRTAVQEEAASRTVDAAADLALERESEAA